MPIRLLTINQYRKEFKKVSRQAILKAINKKSPPLPKVINAKKMGRDWVLEVTD